MPWLIRILAPHHRRRNASEALAALLVALALLPLLIVLLPPRKAAAQSGPPSGSAASTAAVPCLAAPAYAVARSDDTIFAPRTDVHAVLQVSPSSARLLAPLGQRPPGSPASARIQNGIGAIYGLAYDDGALSGTPRLFAAAHLRRFTAFGPGGPGAIYAINPATGAWSLFATVPGNHWDRSGNDPYDSAATARTGTSGLGGIAMHPEGRYLFIVNISERRIERVDVTTGAFLPAMSLAGAYAAIGQSPSDTFPFAITFMPQPVNDLPAMLVGFTNRRAGSVFVAANYRTSSGTWTWGAFLSQNLRSGDFLDRLDGTTLADVIITSPQNGIGGNGAAWNPWVDTEDEMARVGDNVAHPQPILTDLTFAPDGQTLFLGIRDRAGDQLFFRTPPSGGYQVISQGDTLAYRWTGNNWALVSVSRADPLNRAPGDGRAWPAHRYDAFNDNLHNFVVGATPPHIENHMGGLATQPTGVDPAQAQVTATQLFGGSQAGISFYASSGGQESANRIIIGGATSTKAAALGDVEPLCAYAYIQGMVWDDANRDGVRQDGELRRAGVPVELTDAAGTVLAAVATDAQGRYRFAAPPNRDLRVRIAPAAFAAGGVLRGATYTTPNASGDLTRDSDAGPQGISLTGTRSDLLGGSVHDREVARLARQEDRRTLDLGVTTLNPDAWVHVSAPPTAPPTGEIRIDVTVGNRGDFHLYGADAALVRLTLPPGLVPAWVSHNGAVSGQTITWNGVWLTAAPSGDPSVVFTVYAMVPPDRQRGDRLTVEAAVVPPPRLQAVDPPANNQDTATTIVVAPDAWVRVSAPPTALPTQVVRFDVQAGNQGDFHLYGPDAAVVRLTLPPGLIPAWVSHNGAVNGQTITWSGVWLNAVPSGAPTISFTVYAVVPADRQRGDRLTIGAVVVPPARFQGVDPPANNQDVATTRVIQPDPGVRLRFDPSPFPVGTGGRLIADYRNADPEATATAATLHITPPAGVTIEMLPEGCWWAETAVRCTLGDLAPQQTGTVALPVTAPANLAANSLTARAEIWSWVPDHPAEMDDNIATATTDVIRPNVYVSARGPAAIIGWGSVYAYEVDYGNLYRLRPDLTRAAAGVSLRVTLPSDVQFRRASITPDRVNGRVLEWDLGALAPRFQSPQPLTLVVQTDVPAGRTLRMEALIATVTPGDDPADNRAVVETPVDPPPTVEQGQARIRLAINSEFDPLTGGANPTDAVYVTEGTQFAWPAGETLRYTPRLTEIVFPNEWDPLLLFPHYEYRARIIGWRVTGYRDDRGVWHDPRVNAGTTGCSPSPTGLPGCGHAYLSGATLAELRANRPVREDEIARQARVYWSHAPLPAFSGQRGHAYGLERLAPVGIRVAVDAEVWIVNTAPDPDDLWDGEPPEIPVAPLPPPQQQVYEETFTVNLVAPRSVVGPGSLPR